MDSIDKNTVNIQQSIYNETTNLMVLQKGPTISG